MTRSRVSSLLLLALGILGIALVVRACSEHEDDGNFVDFGGGWDVDRLRHDAFRLKRPVRLAVSATGSFETEKHLAAYGWIVRREDRAVVWQMMPARSSRERGTLTTVADTIMLPAGTYDAYFTTFGDPLLPVASGDSFTERIANLLRFGNRPWESDASKWAFRIDLLDDADRAATERLPRDDTRDAAPAGPGLLWAGGPAGRQNTRAFTFDVSAPATIRIKATGELFDGPVDYGWIDDLETGERVWEMTMENTKPAGGSRKNRRFDGALALTPGLYRATYVTDGSHHARDWRANPPLDPAAWGLFLYTDTPDRVAAFDPWDRLPRLVEMTGVGDDALETATFTLSDSLRVWVYALGEMSRRDDYDHAWLLRDDNGIVWEMDYGKTRNAGGAERNRVEETSLVLPPATYTLHFESDDSHSPARWRGDPPDHPERWGVTLFALDDDAPEVAVTRRSERETDDAIPDAAPRIAADGVSELPVRLSPLGNGRDVQRTFTLDRETDLRVYAVGEILRTDRYDYGWISDGNDLVWEMTRSNTKAAGGSRKNRVFKDTVTLPAGTYTVHFRTDDSHAYGDFSQGSPSDPAAWGIAVSRADGPPPPPVPPAPAVEPVLPLPANAPANPSDTEA